MTSAASYANPTAVSFPVAVIYLVFRVIDAGKGIGSVERDIHIAYVPAVFAKSAVQRIVCFRRGDIDFDVSGFGCLYVARIVDRVVIHDVHTLSTHDEGPVVNIPASIIYIVVGGVHA